MGKLKSVKKKTKEIGGGDAKLLKLTKDKDNRPKSRIGVNKAGSIGSHKSRNTGNAFLAPVVKQQVFRFENTYRLEPQRPLNRDQVEGVLRNVVDKSMQNFIYSPKHAMTLCKNMSEEIKFRVKFHGYDRYKYIVEITIGDRFMQGFCSSMTFLWDPEKDGHVNYVYDNPFYFCIATLYYIYYY